MMSDLASLENTLLNAFSNIEEYNEQIILTCQPFDWIMEDEDIGVGVIKYEDGRVMVCVGTEGSVDGEYNGYDLQEAAKVMVQTIVEIRKYQAENQE